MPESQDPKGYSISAETKNGEKEEPESWRIRVHEMEI